jgi:1-acyl-sn-glycerol-3-phosphate acyltransferase
MQALVENVRGLLATVRWVALSPVMMLRIGYLAKDRDDCRRILMRASHRFLATCKFTTHQIGMPPPPGQACVVCYNETSLADVFAITGTVFEHVDIATAAEIFGWIPFSSAASRMVGIRLVVRGNRAATEALMTSVVEEVRQGHRLAWGGEGRQSGHDGVGHFKVGASLIAIRAQVPIMPVAVYGGHQRLRLGTLRARPGPITVRYGAPIPTEGLTEDDARALADRVRDAVVAMYAEAASAALPG